MGKGWAWHAGQTRAKVYGKADGRIFDVVRAGLGAVAVVADVPHQAPSRLCPKSMPWTPPRCPRSLEVDRGLAGSHL